MFTFNSKLDTELCYFADLFIVHCQIKMAFSHIAHMSLLLLRQFSCVNSQRKFIWREKKMREMRYYHG